MNHGTQRRVALPQRMVHRCGKPMPEMVTVVYGTSDVAGEAVVKLNSLAVVCSEHDRTK